MPKKIHQALSGKPTLKNTPKTHTLISAEFFLVPLLMNRNSKNLYTYIHLLNMTDGSSTYNNKTVLKFNGKYNDIDK